MNREEAIEVYNGLINTKIKEAFEFFAPELHESEDERIRKALVWHLKAEADFVSNGVTKEECLVYLEKQKELFESGRGLYYYDGEKTTYCGYPATEENPYDFAMSQQEKQKEQRPLEPSDEGLQRHQDELYNFKVFAARQAREHHISFVYDFEWNNFCAELLSYFNEKQKPAEKQDYSCFNDLERAIHRGFLAAGVENVPVGIIKETAKECLAQMKPAEWSEEDEAHLKWLCRIIRSRRLHGELSLEEESELGKWIDKWINHEPQVTSPATSRSGVLNT